MHLRKYQVHSVEDIRGQHWLWTGWIGCRYDAHWSRWVSNNYITRCHIKFELVGVWSQLLQFEAVRTRPSRELGPQGPRLSSTAERERNAAKDNGNGGQYVAVFVQSTTHLSHIAFSQPFRKKWEVYFSKELFRSSLLRWLCSHMYMCICIIRRVGCDYVTQCYNPAR